MKSSQIKKSISSLLKIKQPAFIWGPPGVGKSQVMHQISNEHDLDIIDLRAILLDPVDLRGIPIIFEEKLARWCPPDFLPKKGKGILFLDELNAAPRSVQAACYQLILDRKIGEYKLPDGWIVMAAGNRDTDRAITNRMPSALANRFVHLNFEINVEDWIKWAFQNKINPIIISFIRFRPDLLFNFDPQRNVKAFSTPRTWEITSKIISTNPDSSIEYELLSGTIGEGSTAELIGFIRIYKSLPIPKSILMNPREGEIPNDPATMFALCGSLASLANTDNIDRIVNYSYRLKPEFSVLLIKDCVNKNSEIVNSSSYIEWISNNQELIF